MNVDEARNILDEDHPFDRGVTNSIFEGMKVITEACDDDDPGMSVEHDQIWYGDFESTVKNMTEEQVRFMAKHGWHENEDAWFTFV